MIFAMFLAIWIDSNHVYIADRTYHESEQACMEAAYTIRREYALDDNGPDKVVTFCIPMLEG